MVFFRFLRFNIVFRDKAHRGRMNGFGHLWCNMCTLISARFPLRKIIIHFGSFDDFVAKTSADNGFGVYRVQGWPVLPLPFLSHFHPTRLPLLLDSLLDR